MAAVTAAFRSWGGRQVHRPPVAGAAAAVGLAAAYSLIIALAFRSWSHLVAQWRADAVLLALVATGFGIQVGLYRHVRQVVRGGGGIAAVSAGGTASSTAAMVACCLHHLSDVVPFVGLAGAAAFLTAYKVPVIAVSLGANAIGIALLARALRHARKAAACH